jgi:hypothetical protein
MQTKDPERGIRMEEATKLRDDLQSRQSAHPQITGISTHRIVTAEWRIVSP